MRYDRKVRVSPCVKGREIMKKQNRETEISEVLPYLCVLVWLPSGLSYQRPSVAGGVARVPIMTTHLCPGVMTWVNGSRWDLDDIYLYRAFQVLPPQTNTVLNYRESPSGHTRPCISWKLNTNPKPRIAVTKWLVVIGMKWLGLRHNAHVMAEGISLCQI